MLRIGRSKNFVPLEKINFLTSCDVLYLDSSTTGRRVNEDYPGVVIRIRKFNREYKDILDNNTKVLS